MLAAALALTLAAFPEFSAPEVLVDLDTRPRQPPVERLLGATASGLLLVTGQPFGRLEEHRLWWAPLAGPATELGLVSTASVEARQVGDRFVVLDANEAVLIDFEGGVPRRVPLVTAASPLQLVRSSSTAAVWFFDGMQLWKTDGTLEGTVLSTRVMQGPALEAEGRIAGFIAPDTISIWEADGARTALITEVHSLSAAGSTFIVGGFTLRNESGEVLLNEPCRALEGGGWALCGSALFSTDGTAANTVLRDPGPVSAEILAISASSLAYEIAPAGSVRLLGRTGVPVNLGVTCANPGPGFRGPFLVCGQLVVPLDGTAVQVTGALFNAAAFIGQLVLLQQVELLVSDGTLAGTRKLELDFGATESSEPTLISSNGTTALFATSSDAGAWLTDGTPEGTVRVGDRASPWGRGALGSSSTNSFGALTAFDEHGKPVAIPPGVVGASREWLIGLAGCRAFRVIADGSSAQFETEGCVTEVFVYDDAAFLRFVDSTTSLVRAPRQPIPLGDGVDREIRPRCDDRRCWYASTRAGSTREVRSVELETAKVLIEQQVNAPGEFELLFGSEEVAVFEARSADANVLGIRRRGASTVIVNEPRFSSSPRPSFAVAKNHDVYVDDGGELTRVGKATRTNLGRCVGARVAASGDDIWAVCENEGEPSFRLFKVVSDTMTEVHLDVAISSPGFDGALAWFSALGPGSPSPMKLFVTDGSEQKQLGSWAGSDFAAVRAGMVFSGTAGVDRELAVVRYARPGCGCESSGGLVLTAALALIISRRARFRT